MFQLIDIKEIGLKIESTLKYKYTTIVFRKKILKDKYDS